MSLEAVWSIFTVSDSFPSVQVFPLNVIYLVSYEPIFIYENWKQDDEGENQQLFWQQQKQ